MADTQEAGQGHIVVIHEADHDHHGDINTAAGQHHQDEGHDRGHTESPYQDHPEEGHVHQEGPGQGQEEDAQFLQVMKPDPDLLQNQGQRKATQAAILTSR